MLLTDVICHMNTEHEIRFLLTAYLENLQARRATHRLPPGVAVLPLAEARLTTFLAADRSGTVDADAVEDAPDAFLSGAITDAQARWNLRKLIGQDNKVAPKQFEVLQRLCDKAGVPAGTMIWNQPITS